MFLLLRLPEGVTPANVASMRAYAEANMDDIRAVLEGIVIGKDVPPEEFDAGFGSIVDWLTKAEVGMSPALSEAAWQSWRDYYEANRAEGEAPAG